jgi:hypothetical protein
MLMPVFAEKDTGKLRLARAFRTTFFAFSDRLAQAVEAYRHVATQCFGEDEPSSSDASGTRR